MQQRRVTRPSAVKVLGEVGSNGQHASTIVVQEGPKVTVCQVLPWIKATLGPCDLSAGFSKAQTIVALLRQALGHDSFWSPDLWQPPSPDGLLLVVKG